MSWGRKVSWGSGLPWGIYTFSWPSAWPRALKHTSVSYPWPFLSNLAATGLVEKLVVSSSEYYKSPHFSTHHHFITQTPYAPHSYILNILLLPNTLNLCPWLRLWSPNFCTGSIINVSLLQTPKFQFVWPHCVVGPQTCINTIRQGIQTWAAWHGGSLHFRASS